MLNGVMYYTIELESSLNVHDQGHLVWQFTQTKCKNKSIVTIEEGHSILTDKIDIANAF